MLSVNSRTHFKSPKHLVLQHCVSQVLCDMCTQALCLFHIGIRVQNTYRLAHSVWGNTNLLKATSRFEIILSTVLHIKLGKGTAD